MQVDGWKSIVESTRTPVIVVAPLFAAAIVGGSLGTTASLTADVVALGLSFAMAIVVLWRTAKEYRQEGTSNLWKP